ncbi:MAG TPA: carboxypeptidase-like regulatory domain-containing protein [Candidatus Sulfotelmatobacter sp.]|nr:carboxypeptidase-like regulatory domain-containing protein [Candidatus Sulfotelmatobacter sp.]
MNARENRKIKRLPAVAVILLLGGCLPVLCLGQQTIVGSVMDKSGKPLAGIEVWGDALSPKIEPAHPHVYAVTDTNGNFSIANPGTTLRINNWTLRPSRIVVTRETRNVEFVAEPASSEAVRVPVCDDSRFAKRENRKRNIGLLWSFLLPRHAKVSRLLGGDYVVETVYFSDIGDHLQFASGVSYGGYEAPSDCLVEAREFTERAIVVPDGAAGVDVYGTLKTGQRFRSFGLGTDAITYQTPNAEAAASFDAFIATACMPRLDSK